MATAFALSRFRIVALIAAAAMCCGCKHAPSDTDAMRAGILEHLATMKTLNAGAMDLAIDRVTYEGSQAHVFVTFRPKTGGPPGAAMQIAYLMEKRDSGWSVVRTEGVGGGISHPGDGVTPNTPPAQAGASGDTPNFRDLTSPAGGTSGGLPPGHPPVEAKPQPKSSSPNAPQPKSQ